LSEVKKIKALTWLLTASLLSGHVSPALARNEPMRLNFPNTEIDAVIGAFGQILNRTFVIDPRVRGKISLETPKAVSPAEAYQLLVSALRLQGFAVVESGNLIRVVPEADAKLQPGPVNIGQATPTRSDAVITQIFRLNYESASNLIPSIKPLISANSSITAVPSSNSIIVTDYAANVQRIGRIIATLDSPSTNEVEVIPVKHTVASDIAVMVARLLDDQQRGAVQDPGQRVSIFADPRLNAVMIRAASASRVNLAKSLIARLDQPSANQGNVHVIYLRNAEATKLAEVLRSTLQGGDAGNVAARAAPAPAPAGAPGSSPAASSSAPAQAVVFSAGGATIAADPATNSLVITAPEVIYRNLRNVIDRLDVRRAQVYIETLIVEITSENAAEFGIQWQSLSKGSGNSSIIGGTNFGTPGGTGNILGATAQGLAALTGGLNVGVVRNGSSISVAGTSVPLNIGALIRALETQSKVNILSTPNLLAIDNEEAKITIGQNVPFITGQYAQSGGNNGAVNPFQTIERKDVGITLKVKPQVSESGTIRLQFFLESSSLASTDRREGVITNIRTINNAVYAEDGQIVVLGGLVEDRASADTESIPGLGSIPILGNLFRSDARKREKTNLLVFMRPVVLRSSDATDSVTSDRYDYLRQIQGNLPIPRHWLLPDVQVPTLPPIPQKSSDLPAQGAVQQPSIAPSVREVQGAPVRPSLPNAKGETYQPKPNEVYVRLPEAKDAPVVAPGAAAVPAAVPAAGPSNPDQPK
jgi:general secretion pathway protein D